MTGMPVVTYQVGKQTAEEFYKTISDADERDWAMTAICLNEYEGLVTKHAYTLLGVVKLTNGPQLVKMRNPHNAEYYTGPFRDDDP